MGVLGTKRLQVMDESSSRQASVRAARIEVGTA
jgi:hypothetical protein